MFDLLQRVTPVTLFQSILGKKLFLHIHLMKEGKEVAI